MSGAARRGALARRHKGGRPAGRRLKIASIGTAAACGGWRCTGTLCVLTYSVLIDLKKDKLSVFSIFKVCMNVSRSTALRPPAIQVWGTLTYKFQLGKCRPLENDCIRQL